MNPFQNCKVVGDNIPPEVYMRQEPGVERGSAGFVMGRSSLMDFLPCPRRWKNGGVEKSSSSLDWGTNIDSAILTPDSFTEKFTIAPETYPASDGSNKPWTRQAKFCKEWEAKRNAAGITVLKQDEYDEVQQALSAFQRNTFAMDILKASKKQVMVIGFYCDESTGLQIPVKCLIDFQPVTGRMLGDYKSSQSAAPGSFEGSIFEYAYDVQAWLSLQLWNTATGEHRDGWQFLVQENKPPFEMPDVQPAIYEGGSFMELGNARGIRALKLYAQCVKTGVWLSYGMGGRLRINDSVYVADTAEWMNRKTLEAFESVTEPKAVKPSDLPPDDTQGITP